ncbi:ABC transporter permease [Dechloromonas sp. HYN0024]|uniref:ABC transporter permease n=1 Tax=Dechloromonas sp. HYN0024 TaxID=2231055 RepID=UPI000E453824|nr:ABC transporter permease [Dechloromonas sp. HYN0024]AXS80357.1 ABC transporter permease [Dechloromonas sp. HYN0024]
MRDFSVTPREMVASLWRNRELIQTFAWREVLGRYRGSILGLLWSFFNPVFMLIVYTFVFSEILKARWTGVSESKIEFALVLFIGLIVYNLFAECITRAPMLILSNPNYVKKVIFPLEILPFVGLYSSIYHALIGLAVWFVAYFTLCGVPHVTSLLIPVVVLPFGLIILGFSWFLASLGVYVRDVSQMIGMLTTVLMFLSPIFYPLNILPEGYRNFLYINPLTAEIEMVRDIIYWGVFPDADVLILYWAASVVVSWLGFLWFQKTRKGFADVL